MGSQPIRKLLGKLLRKLLGKLLGIAQESAREIAREMEEGTKLFKKDSDWWKSSIYNGVMGSQPIRKLLGKLLGK